MSDTLDKIFAKKREAEAAIHKAREELKATAGKFLVELFAPLFAEHPEVKGLKWTQYTPYFNDGDTCEFSSHHEDAEILFAEPDDSAADADEDEESDGEYYIPTDRFGYDSKEYKAAAKIQEKFTAEFPELSDDDMESLFGDHVEVTLFPDRVEVEEYEHE